MVADAVRSQPVLEFFVAILAFAAVGLGIACGVKEKGRYRPVGDQYLPVRALSIRSVTRRGWRRRKYPIDPRTRHLQERMVDVADVAFVTQTRQDDGDLQL